MWRHHIFVYINAMVTQYYDPFGPNQARKGSIQVTGTWNCVKIIFKNIPLHLQAPPTSKSGHYCQHPVDKALKSNKTLETGWKRIKLYWED